MSDQHHQPDAHQHGEASYGASEYLDTSHGDPAAPASGGRGAKLVGFLVAGVAALALLVAGGVWAFQSFMSQGSQPAEALPANTIAYAAIDLDPSGGQKLEAITTLRKFPAFRDNFDIRATDDLKQRIFEEIQKSAGCKNLTYATDIKPWLGDRAAVAGVDVGGDGPELVVVVQIKDRDKANAGFNKIQNCSSSGDANQRDTTQGADGGWAFSNGWAVLAKDATTANAVVAQTAKGSLAKDATYRKWVGEAGDPGIATFYASPRAGQYLVDGLGGFGMPGDPGVSESSGSSTEPSAYTSDSSCDPTAQLKDALQNFKGAAATLRFSDGSLEFQAATGSSTSLGGAQLSSSSLGDLITKLPADTGAAYGMAFTDGWFTKMMTQLGLGSCGSTSSADLEQQVQDLIGLTPADIDELTAGGVVISLGSDVDPEKLSNSDDLAGLPIAVTLKADPAKVQAALDKLNAKLAGNATLQLKAADGRVVVGPDAAYLAHVATAGSLGGESAFRHAVPDGSKASGVLYVNFTANGNWLQRAAAKLSGDDPSVRDNLAPLEGIGLESYVDGDTIKGKLRVSTH